MANTQLAKNDDTLCVLLANAWVAPAICRELGIFQHMFGVAIKE